MKVISRQTLLHLGCIVVLFCVVNSILFYVNGVKVVHDSERYLEYANGLRSGFYFDPHNFWYIGYSLFILFCGGNLTAIIVVQYALSLLAALALYYAGFLLWNSRVVALVASLLFVLFVDISLWNSYILTESVYASFTCFSVLGLVFIYKYKRFVVATIAVILFTALTKPTGIALISACIAVLTSHLTRKWIVYIAVFFVVLVVANRMLSTYAVMENYQLGEVIYGVTTVDSSYDTRGLIVTPPKDIYKPNSNSPVVRILSFAFHHPVYWTQLFLTKAFFLLSHVRPFWSTGHNLFSIFFLLPAYGLMCYSLIRSSIPAPVIIFGVTFLLIHIVSVGLTSDDWDGRFLIPMLPVVFLFAASSLRSYARS